MIKKFAIYFILILISTKILAEEDRPTTEPCKAEQEDCMVLVGGVINGNYNKFLEAFKDIFNKTNKDFKIETVSSNGSLATLKLIRNAQINAGMGIVQSDILIAVKEIGKSLLVNNKESILGQELLNIQEEFAENIAALAFLFDEEIHIFAPKQIAELGNLANKTIFAGAKNSGSYYTANALLKAIGNVTIMDEGEPDRNQNIYKEAITKLLDNPENSKYSAILVVGAQPFPLFKEIASHKNINKFHFVPLKPEISGYKEGKIKKVSYDWLESDIDTLSVRALLVGHKFGIEPKDPNKIKLYEKRCRQMSTIRDIMNQNKDQIGEKLEFKLAEGNLEDSNELYSTPDDLGFQREPQKRPMTVQPATCFTRVFENQTK